MAKRRYQSSRFQERKRKKRIILSTIFSVIGVFIVAGLVWVSHLDFFKITEVEINEMRFVDGSEVEELFWQEVTGRYLFLFSKTNSLLFPRGSIEDALREKYHPIKNINIDFKGFKKVAITISEYEPFAKWCDTSVDFAIEPDHEGNMATTTVVSAVIPDVKSEKVTADAKCYFLNEQGFVFVEEPVIHAGQYMSFFGIVENMEMPLGGSYLNEKQFKNIINFTKLIRRLDITTTEIWAKTDEVFTVVTDMGTQMHIDSVDNIVTVFQNLEAVIEQDAINKAQFKNIEYIDLRFGNRVYYRLK